MLDVDNFAGAYVAILFGFLSILLLTPLLSLALAPMPLSPPEFPLGLALFMSMPSTVSTGVLMTGEAKGNVALAVLFSVGTNLVGVLTVPFWLKAYATDDVAAASSALNPLDLLWKLALTILLPLLVGKSLRYFTRVCDFVKKHKMKLKLLSSALLISVPWITMSVSSAKLRAASGTAILILIGLALALHTLLLVFNYISCMLLRMPQSQKKAVVINASQKTVNTAVSVISFLPPAIGDPGLIMLPCIISHFVQVCVASLAHIPRWLVTPQP
jgi:sodium/bile acid cotransporter 7